MKFFICISLSVLTHSFINAQGQRSFDQFSYNPPSNWQLTDNGSYQMYSILNKTANSFCIVSIYSSDVSYGNVEQDFRKAWKGILASHFTVIKNPRPQQGKTSNGIAYLQDEANVSSDKGKLFARLLVFD